jgi:transposase
VFHLAAPGETRTRSVSSWHCRLSARAEIRKGCGAVKALWRDNADRRISTRGSGGRLDNYATHKTPAIHQWLLKHPRFHLHFTPTSSSWLNLVERWFAELTNRKLRRSAHRSVTELEDDIRRWISELNTASGNVRPIVRGAPVRFRSRSAPSCETTACR